MSHVFHRVINAGMPTAARGDGVYLVDEDGKRYLDASGGAAVSCLGHSDRSVIEAIKAQVDKFAYAHTAFFTNAAAEELADHLAARAPGDLDYCYFVSGGSEAMEAALKLARQYHLEAGEARRSRFVSRRQSYHGNTLGALAVGGNPARRAPYAPLLMPVEQIAPCYAYREKAETETEEEYGRRVADELATLLKRIEPETVAAFIAEPVVGATLGAVPAVPGYFKRIREICDAHGILLILDEVMCGMGRTGTLFACEQDGVVPDIVTMAKGLGAGYQAIGAMMVSDRIYGTIARGSGAFQHGHTYMGHATACAASLAVQKAIVERDLLAGVRTKGEKLDRLLKQRFAAHPHVGDVRGRGLFRGIELVADRDTKAPFAAEAKLHARVKRQAMANGLMCYPNSGSVDGVRGDHVLLAPPFIVEDGHLEEIVDKLASALDAALKEAGASLKDARAEGEAHGG
jgi:adenosylmethionine-8-amino-7-oxononanoate aminotransferase